MRRAFYSPRLHTEEGSERAVELAVALAQISDEEFLRTIIDIKAALDRIGGQVYIAAFRNKYDPATGEQLEDPSAPGRYETDGYAIHYEHIAKLTDSPREPDPRVEKLAEVREEEGWEQDVNPDDSEETTDNG